MDKKSFKYKSKIGRKIFICMLLASLGMGIAIFYMSYKEMNMLYIYSANSQMSLGNLSAQESKGALLKETEDELDLLTILSAENINLKFERVSKEINSISDSMNQLYKNKNEVIGFIPPRPEKTKDGEVMGRGTIVKGVKSTPELIDEQKLVSCIEYYASGVYENEADIRMVLIGTETGIFYRYSDYNTYAEDYDPRERDWYKAALDNPDTVVWSDAYVEAYGNYVVTCSETFRDEYGNIAGVIASDITIQSIIDNIMDMSDVGGRTGILIDQNGDFLAKPDGIEDNFVLSPEEGGSKERYDVVQKMLNGESGVVALYSERVPQYIAYAPIEETGWSMAIVIPFDYVTKPAVNTEKKIKDMSASTQKSMAASMEALKRRCNVISAICLILVSIISYIIATTIKKPIVYLHDKVNEIGGGNLDAYIDVKGTDEIADLGNAFNKMTTDLKEHIDSLTKIMEEKHKTEAELGIATKIQSDMLPSIFPDFVDKEEYELFALMEPAKEVGGDFYDFFTLDDNHIALVIADVSGKGVPAALFMMITKTLIKDNAQSEASAAAILRKTNEHLCENNGAEMFATAWLGIIDITTGHMCCASAGHEYPIIKTANGKFEVFKDKHGFVLGGMEMSKYKDYEIELEKGGMIFVYTDGAPEAQNSENEFYGMDRLVEALNNHSDLSPVALITAVKADVDNYVGDAPQFDDLTMLCYKRK